MLMAIACLYLLVALPVLAGYMQWTSANFLIGLPALLLMHTPLAGSTSGRFGWLALAVMITVLFLPVKTGLYAALCCVLLCLYECGKGKVTLLPVLTLFFMSPVCQYFAQVFSFPVRLRLTGIAGSVLQGLGKKVSIAGNIIFLDGTEFSVDPACMGLGMLVTSLLCGIIMIELNQKKQDKLLGPGWVGACLFLIFLLNIGSNLLRILLLVCFRLMPDQVMHGVVGILCLLVYVLLPGMWIINKMVRRLGKPQPQGMPEADRRSPQRGLAFALLLLPLFVSAVFRISSSQSLAPAGALPVLTGYRSAWYNKEIAKLESATSLVYIKPLKGFVYTDHNPLICWSGSGYVFDRVEERTCAGIVLYTGVLTRGREKLYTAWWYDNGSMATASQWTWRWQMLRGSPAFSIINVTAADPRTLDRDIAYLAAHRPLLAGRQP